MPLEQMLESENNFEVKDENFRTNALHNWHKLSTLINEESGAPWKETIIYNLRRR